MTYAQHLIDLLVKIQSVLLTIQKVCRYIITKFNYCSVFYIVCVTYLYICSKRLCIATLLVWSNMKNFLWFAYQTQLYINTATY